MSNLAQGHSALMQQNTKVPGWQVILAQPAEGRGGGRVIVTPLPVPPCGPFLHGRWIWMSWNPWEVSAGPRCKSLTHYSFQEEVVHQKPPAANPLVPAESEAGDLGWGSAWPLWKLSMESLLFSRDEIQSHLLVRVLKRKGLCVCADGA